MRKLIPLLLAACGGSALQPGQARISGAQNAVFSIGTPKLGCCSTTVIDDCMMSGCIFTLDATSAGLSVSLPARPVDGTYTDMNTPGSFLRCYTADVSPQAAQNGIWDVQPGKQGSFALTLKSLSLTNTASQMDWYRVHGSLHAQCMPSDKLGPGNPATGTLFLDAEF